MSAGQLYSKKKKGIVAYSVFFNISLNINCVMTDDPMEPFTMWFHCVDPQTLFKLSGHTETSNQSQSKFKQFMYKYSQCLII